MSKIFPNLPPIHEQLIGHRGAAGLAPENTLASFKKAKELGLNWVEFDVQRCGSGEWIVFHDETLERTTNGQGKVSNTAYEIIKTLDAGLWFNPQFKNEPVPLLLEVLPILLDLDLHPNIEIKMSSAADVPSQKDLIKFLQILENTWPKTKAAPLISSFHWDTLIRVQSLNSLLPLGFITENPTRNVIDQVKGNRLNSLHCNHQNIHLSELQYAKEQMLPVLAYTVNNPEKIKSLLAAGVGAVFSDLTFYSKKSIL